MRRRLGVVARLLSGLLACGTAVAATDFDLALRLLEQGEGLRALSRLRPLAEGGNAEAQYRLGTIFERGIGIVPDDYWAWYWYQLAAAQGHTPAIEALAALGERTAALNEGAPADAEPPSPTEAAVDAGAPAMDAMLADPFQASSDTSVPAIPAETDAADGSGPVTGAAGDAAGSIAGAPDAATPSAAGQGELRPPGPGELAALAKARERGVAIDFDASVPLPLPRGDDTTEEPTGDGPGAAPARAGPLRVAAAGATGLGTAGTAAPAPAPLPAAPSAFDPATLAEPALTQLAAGGDVAAQRELAGRLHAGRGRPRDLRSAVVWYRRAAEAGDAEAQFQLGNLYLMGEGIEADDAWAITWFRRAAGQGHAKAQAHLENLLKLSGGRP